MERNVPGRITSWKGWHDNLQQLLLPEFYPVYSAVLPELTEIYLSRVDAL